MVPNVAGLPPQFAQLFGDVWPDYRERVERSLGSGIIWDVQGHVVTNYHVIAQATQIKVQLKNGKSGTATLVGADPDTDLAVLQDQPRHAADHAARALGPAAGGRARARDRQPDRARPDGDPGHRQRDRPRTAGRHDLREFHPDRRRDQPRQFRRRARRRQRQAGRPQQRDRGRGRPGIEGIGFAIPVDLVRGVVDAILRDGKVVRGWIGVVPSDIAPEAIEQSGLPEGSVLVRLVSRNGPADQQGIVPGDVITQVNGKPLRGAQDLLANIAMLKPGQPVRLRLWRRSPAEPEGLEHNVRLEVIERPQQAGAMRSS